MRQNAWRRGNDVRSSAGFTLIELMVVVFLAAVLAAMAVPSFAQWRQSLEYREAARNIVSQLREARSRAIAANREHRVEFEPAAGRYGLRAGDRAQNTNWATVPPITNWSTLPNEVNMSSNVGSIQFNTNGTANGGTITVRDGALNDKYKVVIVRTGRIRIR